MNPNLAICSQRQNSKRGKMKAKFSSKFSEKTRLKVRLSKNIFQFCSHYLGTGLKISSSAFKKAKNDQITIPFYIWQTVLKKPNGNHVT
jgi:hypothetical protein